MNDKPPVFAWPQEAINTMITIEAPWEAQLNWAEDCKRDSYVFDGVDNQIAGPVSMDEAILVAALPELMIAAERALNFIENTESEIGCSLESGDLLRAAIKKAKGE